MVWKNSSKGNQVMSAGISYCSTIYLFYTERIFLSIFAYLGSEGGGGGGGGFAYMHE
jgi:hypothetical protein